MNVYLIWSGDRGKRFAAIMRDWLPKVIQAVKPWFSEDISKGARWLDEIWGRLKDTKFAVICLTSESQDAPWVNFESGVIAKVVSDEAFVCPYLLDFEPSQLRYPLAQFQITKATKEDTLRLLYTMNQALASPLDKATLEATFEVWWPKLEEELRKIPKSDVAMKKRDPEEILDEILKTVRAIAQEGPQSKRSISVTELMQKIEKNKEHFPPRNVITGEYLDLLQRSAQLVPEQAQLIVDQYNAMLQQFAKDMSNIKKKYEGQAETFLKAFNEATEKKSG